jgi:hypothetical protein
LHGNRAAIVIVAGAGVLATGNKLDNQGKDQAGKDECLRQFFHTDILR